jgi:hypothetical protein
MTTITNVVWATFTDGTRIARASDFPPGANPRAISSRAAQATGGRGGRALDATPPPTSNLERQAARLRAHQWIVRFRAAQAFDAQLALPRQPDYRALQTAADEKRGVPARFGGVIYKSDFERDLARRRQRACGGMDSASDSGADRYIYLNAAYEAKRKGAS